jgi:hypothetical protein
MSEIAIVPAAVAGVYVLHTYLAPLSAFPVIYAGEARDLKKRLLQHFSGSRKEELTVIGSRTGLFFSIAPVREPATRARVESALVYFLQPTCNERQPSAAPLLVTLPRLRLETEDVSA